MADEAIFGYLPNQLTEQEIAELHRRAEYLLDEMEMGGADRNAFDGEGDLQRSASSRGPKRPAHPTQTADHAQNGNGQNQAYFTDRPEYQSSVLPDTALPSIRSRSRPSPVERPPGYSEPQPSSAQPRPTQGTPQTKSSYDGLFPSRRRAPVPVSQPAASISASEARAREDEIAQLQEQINRLKENRREITGHALSLLREARTIVHSQPERLGRAEHNIRQVRTILQRAKESRFRSIRNSSLLLLYLLLWLAICAGGIAAMIVYYGILRSILVEVMGTQSVLGAHALPFLWALLAGAAGGGLGAIFCLVGQMRAGQEFDRQHVVRYVVQPIMGVVLAISIYTLSAFIFSTMGSNLTDSLVTQALPAFMALPAALWQENVYGMLYRFTRFFRLSRQR